MFQLSFGYNNESIKTNNNIIGGNITDRALLKFINTDLPKVKVLKQVPFHSKNKY